MLDEALRRMDEAVAQYERQQSKLGTLDAVIKAMQEAIRELAAKQQR
jgi:hypothetical protein